MMRKILYIIYGVFLLAGGRLAWAEDTQLARFDDWAIIKGEEDGQKYCYAVTVPFETRAYYSVAERFPYMLIAYVDPDRFTMGVDNGYLIDKKEGVSVTINHRTRMLNVVSMYRNARTYSSVEDVAMINEMVKANSVIEVRSSSMQNSQAIDYYSIKPIKEVLSYMLNNCN